MRGDRKRTTGTVVVFLIVAALAFGGRAWAQTEPYGNGEPTVKPTLITRDSTPAVEPNRESAGVLPFTGGDVTVFLVLGLGAISVGVVLLRRRAAGSA